MESEESGASALWVRDCGRQRIPINLDAYLSDSGMVTIPLDEDDLIEMSPLVANEFVQSMLSAIGEAKENLNSS